ncbi:MAG: hypothetical protein M5U32_17850 [Myxococcota bacterium]|nr:hypothetical protein [Myxococcota bacterium]
MRNPSPPGAGATEPDSDTLPTDVDPVVHGAPVKLTAMEGAGVRDGTALPDDIEREIEEGGLTRVIARNEQADVERPADRHRALDGAPSERREEARAGLDIEDLDAGDEWDPGDRHGDLVRGEQPGREREAPQRGLGPRAGDEESVHVAVRRDLEGRHAADLDLERRLADRQLARLGRRRDEAEPDPCHAEHQRSGAHAPPPARSARPREDDTSHFPGAQAPAGK